VTEAVKAVQERIGVLGTQIKERDRATEEANKKDKIELAKLYREMADLIEPEPAKKTKRALKTSGSPPSLTSSVSPSPAGSTARLPIIQSAKLDLNDMAEMRAKFAGISSITLSEGVGGVYLSLFPTGEIKVGVSDDIMERHRDTEFKGARLLAVLPKYHGVETDLHAVLLPYRSREFGPLHTELYFPVEEIYQMVLAARERNFAEDELRSDCGNASQELMFDNGEVFSLELTPHQFIERGSLVPRYAMFRTCRTCQETRHSIKFLNDFTIESFGNNKTKYLVLQSTDFCSSCAKKTLPSAVAFPKPKETRIRVGRLVSQSGEVVEGYDRDKSKWGPLHFFGIRRMNSALFVLRFQPSSVRHGDAQNPRGAQATLNGFDGTTDPFV